MKPLVSVVIPTRDRPRMLRDAIKSVRAQTMKDFEIIVVVNDVKNEHTAQTMQEAAGCNVVRIPQHGIAAALNAGVRAAEGEWIAFLDDDDFWEPNWLQLP